MTRRSCSMCGAVEIGLVDAEVVARSGLFTRPRQPSLFWMEVVLNGADADVEVKRSFGRAPEKRRRPLHAVA